MSRRRHGGQRQIALDEINAMRIALAILLILFGSAAVLIALLGPLANLVSDYQDSPVSTYLLYGLPPLAGGLAALILAWRLLKS